jgi:uncharacterized protein (TIGR02646 family)
MKFVNKGGPPYAYRAWWRSVLGTNNEDYGAMPGNIKSAVLAALARDQGEICAYTMRRIDMNTSHIEHVKPESLCRLERKGLDLDFSNMLACFPRDGMPRRCRYGAQKKDNWWNPALFISPLSPACEKRFHFDLDGEISTVGTNEAAINTIRILGLDNKSLTEDRRRAVREFIYGDSGSDPLSKANASRLRAAVCSKSGTRYTEFCVALRDALDDYIKYLDKLARNKKFARNKKR